MGQHRVRPERADLADELLSKRQLVRKGTVGLVQERDPRVADDLRGAPCLRRGALFFRLALPTFPPSHLPATEIAYQTRILSCSEMQPSIFPRIVGT